MLENGVSASRATSPRNTYTERADSGDGAGMRAAVGAPDERQVINVGAFERSHVGPIVGDLPLVHGFGAVEAGVYRVGRSDADIQGSGGVAQSGRQDVGWSKSCARYEAGHLGLGGRIALKGGVENLPSDGIMTNGGFRAGAPRGR